jgi:4-methylaminobutanoate oxidase (formaldehyde-forming)
MLGLFEWEGAAWNGERDVPIDFSFGEIQPDWDRMGPYIEAAIERVPEVANVGIRTLFCGPESFTPDSCPVVGESHELRNYYIAAGMNSVGILTGGGIGNILARWIQREGLAPNDVDCTGINAHRFHRYQCNPEYRATRVRESLGNTYRVHYPDHQPETCRNAKRSPLHDRLWARNAYFRDVSGWESPAWYAPAGIEPVVERESFEREPWFRYWEAEHLNCRNNVSFFDMSFMSKFLVQGPNAGSFLNRLSTADVDSECGRITYTQWLNEEGYMEADLTVSKLSEGRFLVVATDTMHNHVLHHMHRRLPREVYVSDVTGRYAQINVQGPRSRDLLQAITSVDMSSIAFRHVQDVHIGLARAICARITYVGELGYELFIPVEQSTLVYDRLVHAGAEFSLQPAGLKALGSLRLVCLFPAFDCVMMTLASTNSPHSFQLHRRRDIATTDMIWTTPTHCWNVDLASPAILTRRSRSLGSHMYWLRRRLRRREEGLQKGWLNWSYWMASLSCMGEKCCVETECAWPRLERLLMVTLLGVQLDL